MTRSTAAFCFQATPTIVSACTFAAYAALTDAPLTAASAFTALALFNLLKQPLRQMPRALTSAVDLHVSFRRLDRFFALGEIERLRLDDTEDVTLWPRTEPRRRRRRAPAAPPPHTPGRPRSAG